MITSDPSVLRDRPLGSLAHPADQQVLLRYLLAAGLIDRAMQSHPQTVVFDYSRLQQVWLVCPADGRRLFVKRARARSASTSRGLSTEIHIYQLAMHIPALQGITPACLWIDSWQHILVLEAVQPGDNLHIHHYAHGPTAEHAQQLGQALAVIHGATAHIEPNGIPHGDPWILDILGPNDWQTHLTDKVLVHGTMRRMLARHLADLKSQSQRTSLTHGDMKWGNCLIGTDGIKVIDWELAVIGDPAWDVAGILQEYIALPCIQPIQLATAVDLRRCAESFLQAYAQESAIADWESFSRRAARLTGARLVQIAYEYAATTPNASFIQILVRRGLEIVEHPERLLEGQAFS